MHEIKLGEADLERVIARFERHRPCPVHQGCTVVEADRGGGTHFAHVSLVDGKGVLRVHGANDPVKIMLTLTAKRSQS